MDNDKRNNQPPVPANLEQLLTCKQAAALKMIQSLGWKLKFVRRPMFMDPQPVVYNAKFDQIGILDTDGNINLELDLDTRTSEAEQEVQPTAAPAREEKRNGTAPVPDDLDSLLNELQLRALKHIESFGWRLHFVRRPLFQDPVPGILNPEGNKIATLEKDGRINLLPDSAVRKDDKVSQGQQANTTAPGLQTLKNQLD